MRGSPASNQLAHVVENAMQVIQSDGIDRLLLLCRPDVGVRSTRTSEKTSRKALDCWWRQDASSS